MSNLKLTIARIVVPLVILAAGAGVSRWIATQQPSAERKASPKPFPIVEVVTLTSGPRAAVITATGVVTAAQELVMTPQVSGQVVSVAKSLVPGGRVKRGETLVRIDPRDYRLAVEQQSGELRRAELEVELETAQQELARHEWALLEGGGEAPPLFSRESQKAAAEAALRAGKRGLDRAKLSLTRTTLSAPFDATVISENVEVGQVVGPQSQLARLIGTDEMWAMVSVPVEELALLDIPGVTAAEGSTAEVEQRLAHRGSIKRSGRVSRLINQLDERTRRAQVVVTIHDALDSRSGLPLLAGAHVDVELRGRTFDAVYAIPREAVYEGNVVWTMERDGTLARREVQVAWGDAEQLFVTSGIHDGARLVLTRLAAPLPGMKVRELSEVAELGKASAAEGTSAPTASPPETATKGRASNPGSPVAPPSAPGAPNAEGGATKSASAASSGSSSIRDPEGG